MSADSCTRHHPAPFISFNKAGKPQCQCCEAEVSPWSDDFFVPLSPTLPADSYFAAVRTRAAALEQGKTEIRQGFLLLAQCREHVKSTVRDGINALKEIEREALSQLDRLKDTLETEVEAGIQEAEKAVFSGETTRTKIAAAILTGECLQIFQYQIRDFVPERLEDFLIVNTYLQCPDSNWLVAIPGPILGFFDITSCSWLSTPLTIPIPATSASNLMLIGEAYVLVCGGGAFPCKRISSYRVFRCELSIWGRGKQGEYETWTLRGWGGVLSTERTRAGLRGVEGTAGYDDEGM